MSQDPWTTAGALAELFTRLDSERGIPPETQWALQALKLSEEVGETAQAVIGAWGTNPRKGRSHDWAHVQEETADAVITGMVALARMRPTDASAFFAQVLAEKAAKFLPDDGPGAGLRTSP